jgi:hypothetical protein
MRQDRRPHQQGVVCKTAAPNPGGAEVLRLPRFAPELSCCLQDGPLRGRRAKPVRRNALGLELRCCLQDCRASAFGRGPAGAAGCAQRQRDSFADTASSNRDGGSAIFGGCPGRPPGIRDQRLAFSGDTRYGAGTGNRFHRRLPGGAGASKAGRPAGSRGNAVQPYERRCLTPPGMACRRGLNLETTVEWLPRPRQWFRRPTTSPRKMRAF